MQLVAPGLAHDADLAAGARTVFRWVIARLDAKLLNRLEARLQSEAARNLAVQVAGRCVQNGSCLDAVDANRVLLISPPAKPNIVERAAAGGLSARSEEIKL